MILVVAVHGRAGEGVQVPVVVHVGEDGEARGAAELRGVPRGREPRLVGEVHEPPAAAGGRLVDQHPLVAPRRVGLEPVPVAVPVVGHQVGVAVPVEIHRGQHVAHHAGAVHRAEPLVRDVGEVGPLAERRRRFAGQRRPPGDGALPRVAAILSGGLAAPLRVALPGAGPAAAVGETRRVGARLHGDLPAAEAAGAPLRSAILSALPVIGLGAADPGHAQAGPVAHRGAVRVGVASLPGGGARQARHRADVRVIVAAGRPEREGEQGRVEKIRSEHAHVIFSPFFWFEMSLSTFPGWCLRVKLSGSAH